MKVDIISFQGNILHWERDLAARLHEAGHDVHTDYREAAPRAPFLQTVIALEGRRTGVAVRPVSLLPVTRVRDPDVVLDLTGEANSHRAPVLTVEIGGCRRLTEGLMKLRSGSGLVDLLARCDGRPVGHASPLISDRVWLSRDVQEVLASIQSLILQCLARMKAGVLDEIAVPPTQLTVRRPEFAYVTRLIGGLATRALKRMTPGSRDFSWRTAYRFIDGPGIGETKKIEGPPSPSSRTMANVSMQIRFPSCTRGDAICSWRSFPTAAAGV
ncbi:hypothetical protein P6U16_23000 (plasmid) [Rhizobium sp. 32-5/1]|uniref:hypothetical protein n=1 Tax=Rhizobium sp. 32-5/1 TaxID=3019602 RepID=UPI00240E3B6A|nr:hypothetical protein [Rhizobium sp. 32-5/1]WEZ85866.1 hypothetical protein P6U16_23000 [Rhizobium sp. 32-5/1]